MKWTELKEILDEEFPKESAYTEDFIGEQIKIKSEVENIMVTLDVTLDVIAQAQEKNIDLIISHHPLFFGDKEEILNNDFLAKSKNELLKKLEIGLYVIHTNADFNPNSIAFMQGLAIGLDNIEQSENNEYITGEFKKPLAGYEIIEKIKSTLELNDVEFRSNFDLEKSFSKLLIASGAAGDVIKHNDMDLLNIIGEIKHNHWVKSLELGTNVLEISHYSEKIFKNIVEVFLDKENVKVHIAKEENGYKII